MFLLLTFVAASAAPPTLPPASAEDRPMNRRERRAVQSLQERHVDFEDPVDVIGTLAGPGIRLHADRPVPAHPPLFELRQDFNDAVATSVDQVR